MNQPRRVSLSLGSVLALGAGGVGCGPSITIIEAEGSGGSAATAPGSLDGGPALEGGDDDDELDDDGSPPDDDTDADTAGSPSGDDGEPVEPTTPIVSSSAFIDAFAAEEGLYVVHADGVFLVSRGGDVVASYESPRAIESAAFDGDAIGVADQAMLTVLDAGLVPGAEAELVERCASAVMVSGPRFVCGPENDWDRIFYTYDGTTGELLGMSNPETYHGIPMRGVPGTDDFVTVTIASSPSDFHLYRAEGDPTVFVNESPYHGDFIADLVQAYVGNPATHLVNSQGTMLEIDSGDCAPGSSFESQCFVIDGSLGTLPSGVDRYIDLREGADGFVYGIFTTEDVYAYDPLCPTGCTVQRIDAAAHVAVAEVTIATEWELMMLRPDPTGEGTFVIGATKTPFAGPYLDDEPGFDVYYLAF